MNNKYTVIPSDSEESRENSRKPNMIFTNNKVP